MIFEFVCDWITKQKSYLRNNIKEETITNHSLQSMQHKVRLTWKLYIHIRNRFNKVCSGYIKVKHTQL